jgi:hypothetical protein
MNTKNYSLMQANEDGTVTLGIIKTMIIKVDRHYAIKPSKTRGGAKFCRVISVASDHAVCEISKQEGRGYYARTKLLDGLYVVPFEAFLEGDF